MMRYAILLALLLCLPVRGEAWQLVGVVASGSFLLDEFDESSATVLTSHAPEIGGSWSEWTWSSTTTVGAGIGTVSADGTTWFYNAATPPSADYTVTVKGKIPSTSWDRSFGAVARMDANKNGYAARLEGGGALKIMRKVTTDNFSDWWTTEIGTPGAVSGFSTSTVYTIAFTVEGSELTARCYDGATLKATATATDSTHTGAGYAGFFMAGSTSTEVYSIEAQ